MYSMLNDKQKDATEMTKKLSELEDTLVALDSAVSKKLDLLRDRELEIEDERRVLEEQKAAFASEKEENLSKQIPFNEALAEKFSEETSNNDTKSNGNMEILTLHDEGLSEVEIAKKLGRGLGEVKFVLGLYQEGR